MPTRDRAIASGKLDRLSIHVYLNSQGQLETMADDVRRGLSSSPKYLQPKYLYDERGSELFEQITQVPEYYPARTEAEILDSLADELMAGLHPQELVELGSGSSSKTRKLLGAESCPDHLRRYLPFDVSEGIVRSTAQELLSDYPFLEVGGIIGDFERDLGHIPAPQGRRLVLFLGSTIGNLDSKERLQFLSQVRTLLGDDGRFLIGLDLVKDTNVLHAAYNDASGVTAEFNRNILRVINNALHADFSPDAFRHRAFFNSEASRIEMHLVPDTPQTIHIRDLGMIVRVERGESIWTESSYKFTRESASTALAETGMRLERWYTDAQQLFGLALAAPA
jgi:L-histidine N-alpha-methyltransferase